jgi:hypothetical protein
MGTTNVMGIPFPENTDAVANGALAMKNLASQVDGRTGLVKVIPTGATNGVVTADGDVTINSAVSSVTVSGAFSAIFDNYLIVISGGTASVNGGIALQLSNSTGSTYFVAGTYGNYGINSGLAYNPTAATKWDNTLVGGTTTYLGSVFLSSPFASRATTGYTETSSQTTFHKFSLLDTSTNSSTGFTFTPFAGTLTGGTIRVYGYRN